MSATANIFVARASWPIPPNMDEVPTPTFVKTEKAEKTQPKQSAIPCALIINKPSIANQQKKNVDGDHNAPSVCNPP